MGSLVEEIKEYIDTYHPVIYIESLDEIEADSVVKELAEKCNKRTVFEYSHKYMFEYKNGIKIRLQKEVDVSKFLDNRLTSDTKKQFIVLKDIHKYLIGDTSAESANLILSLKNLVYKIVEDDGKSENTIFIISPILAIPPEIAKFITVFKPKSPDEQVIASVIDAFCKTQEIQIQQSVKQEIINRLKGLSGYEINKILALALYRDGRINQEDFDLISKQKSQMVMKNGVLEMIEVKAKPDSLAGLQNLKYWIGKKSKIFERLAEAKTKKIDPPKGVMLVGLPGCGKSLSAEVIAAIMKTPLLRLDMGKLLGKYVGESEENMRRAIHLAEAVSPCVLWIDEIEKAFVGVSGDSGGSDVSKRMFGSFLTWMQEKTSPVFVVATANDITSLPPELLRKGRFDELFSVALPNKDEREGIFAVHLKKRDADSGIDKKRLAELSEGFIGAEIESVVKDALEEAFIDQKQFNTALLERITKELKPMSKSQKAKIDSYNQKIKELDIKSAS